MNPLGMHPELYHGGCTRDDSWTDTLRDCIQRITKVLEESNGGYTFEELQSEVAAGDDESVFRYAVLKSLKNGTVDISCGRLVRVRN